MNKPNILSTTLVYYYFDITDSAQMAEWMAMKAEREAEGVECFNAIAHPRDHKYHGGGNVHGFRSTAVQLETEDLKCAFDNQWNTIEGQRVFDWYEGIVPNKSIKAGHYIRITKEIHDYRARVFKCGYCGEGYWSESGDCPEPGYCTACLSSPHLKETDLHLLVLSRLRLPFVTTKELQTYRAHSYGLIAPELHARYLREQGHATSMRDRERQARDRANVIADYTAAIDAAAVERDGKLWFLDNGYKLDNLIYYKHTGSFCYGWLRPLSNNEAAEWEVRLMQFPAPIEIKREK